MTNYYDTSFLVSVVLGQHQEIDYDKFWKGATYRVSSHLIRIESYIAIQRAGLLIAHENESWAENKMDKLVPYLDCITCKYIDDSIEEIIKSRSDLTNCRALDAIHLGTGLFFQSHLPESLALQRNIVE